MKSLDIGSTDMPLELVTLLTLVGALGEQPTLCDCPPGMCLSEPASDDLDDEDDDGEFEIEFEPDFELSDDELSMDDKVEAVAQLGRITEGLTSVVEIHAKLLKDLVG